MRPWDILRVARSRQKIQLQARHFATLNESDEAACRGLSIALAGLSASEITSQLIAWPTHDDYIEERACRLLAGVLAGGVVPQPDPVIRERFRAEETLGRIPPSEAFEIIAKADPRIADAVDAISVGGLIGSDRLALLLADHRDDPILGSSIAREVVFAIADSRSKGYLDDKPVLRGHARVLHQTISW